MEKLQNKTPLVRFPEFKDNWEHKKLDNFLTLSLNPISKPKDKYLSIGIRSHFKGTFQKPSTDPDKNIMDTLYSVKENNLLVNITFAWEGALSIVPKEDEGGLVSHRFPTYIFDETKVSHTFFQYLFFRNKFKHELGIISPGGAGRNRVLNKKDFLKLKCLFPTLPEQKRIAHFFTVLDNKINELKEKKSLLEEYKKGVMQKIFSQELRFRDDDGKEFDDWEEKKLGEVLESISTKKFQIKSTQFQQNGNYRIVDQGQELIAGYSNSKDSIFKNLPVIVFGDHTTILKYIDFEFIVGADGTKLLKNKNNDNLKYLFYNLEFNNVQQEGYKRHFSMLLEVYLQMPCLAEQTKIANFLSKIDEKIKTVNEQIEKSMEYKKGLLQKMYCV